MKTEQIIEAAAKELVNNWTQGYIGDVPAILRRHFAPFVEVEQKCRRRLNSGVSPGVQIYAGEILKTIGWEESE